MSGLMLSSPDASLLDGGSVPPSRFNGTVVRFHTRSVQNSEKTAQEGRPMYDAAEYIEIRVPGDKSNIVHRQVRDSDRRDYAQQYASWKAGAEEQVVGTPLAMWPPVTAEQVLELSHFGVKTVEHLATVTDANLTNIGPFRALREQAKAWLEAARGHAPVARLTAEKEAMALELAGLREQVKGLEAALSKSKAGK